MLDRKPPEEFRDRLADLIVSLRPDWSRPHVIAAIENAERRERIVTLAQFTAAAINVAQERAWRTPRIIALDGPHWPASDTIGSTADRGRNCLECGRPEATCRAAEARVGVNESHEYRGTP